MRKGRGIIIRIKRKKITSRRKLGKENAKGKEAEEQPEEINQAAEEEKREQTKEEIIDEPREKGKFVLPGELIGTSEEFTPRSGTFEDKGNIYAAIAGMVNENSEDRSISVEPVTSTPPILHVGDIVIGQITTVKDSVALVEIAHIKGKGERQVVGEGDAAIHVSNVKDAYVKELYHEFAPFDIVKAKVLDLRTMRLTTVDKELGVMKAFCGNCRTALKIDKSKLKCPKCERTETRKLSSDYGTGII